MYKYKIEIRVKEFSPPFKPEITRQEFEVEAETELQAIKLASGKVKSRGYPYDEKSVRVLFSSPVVNEEKCAVLFPDRYSERQQGAWL